MPLAPAQDAPIPALGLPGDAQYLRESAEFARPPGAALEIRQISSLNGRAHAAAAIGSRVNLVSPPGRDFSFDPMVGIPNDCCLSEAGLRPCWGLALRDKLLGSLTIAACQRGPLCAREG